MDDTSEPEKTSHWWHKSWIPIAAIVIVAGVLRYLGLDWGLPNEFHLFSYHPDEFHSLRGALSMMMGDTNPHFFNYGSLYLYLIGFTALFFSGGSFALVTVDQAPHLLRNWTLLGREITVVMALLTVIAVYYLGRELVSRRIGLIAAALAAVFPIHVLHSHYATVDVTQTLFTTVCLIFAVRIYQDPRRRNYIFAGLAAGLAASTKYNGAVVLVAPIAAHFLRMMWVDSEGIDNSNLLWLLGLAPLAFLLTSPYTVLDWQAASSDIAYEIQHMRVGEEPAKSADPSGTLFHLMNLSITTLGGTVLALLGAAGLLLRPKYRGKALTVVIFAAVWFVMIASSGVRYMRYEMPLVPVVAVLAPAVLLLFRHRRPEPKVIGIALLVAVFVGSAYISVQADRQMMDVDPRDRMLFAIDRHVPVRSKVGVIWEPWFHGPPLDYVNGGAALRSNPVWEGFSRNVREFVVLGISPEDLKEKMPSAVAYSNFEMRDSLRVGRPPAEEFIQVLEDEYRPLWSHQSNAPLSGVLGWVPPQDWLYPFPTLKLWGRDSESDSGGGE